MNRRRRNKVLDGTASETESEFLGGTGAGERIDGPRRMALHGLADAFEEAERGRDWFAMKAALGRVDDAMQAVWYAARVRDDGRR